MCAIIEVGAECMADSFYVDEVVRVFVAGLLSRTMFSSVIVVAEADHLRRVLY